MNTDDSKTIAETFTETIKSIEAFIDKEKPLMGMSDFDTRESAYHARVDRGDLLAIAKRQQAELERLRPVDEAARTILDRWEKSPDGLCKECGQPHAMAYPVELLGDALDRTNKGQG